MLVQIEKSGALVCNNDQTIFSAGFKHNQGAKAGGIGYEIEKAPTLNAEQRAAICMQGSQVGRSDTAGPGVIGWWNESDVGATVRTPSGGDSTKANLVVAAVDCRNGTENQDVNGTLHSKPSGGQSINLQNVCSCGSIVRRLTPLECERLQGFPDGWTDIGEWADSKGKRHESSNRARYKALGNSIALPPWTWVLKRLCACYERTATMASLFDGIGGFPLIWERMNGDGTCLWASEIEEFPIAVTRLRFPEKGRDTT